jgi:solute carrier family 36 (proton-coupled amino acid transporter)
MTSFAYIGYRAFGHHGAFWTNIALLASQLGFCTAYVSFISHNMTDIIESVTRIEWVLILLPILAALVQIREIKYIAPTSTLGNVIYGFAIFVIFYEGFADHCCVAGSDMREASLSGLPITFGTLVFSLEGIGLVLPLEQSMKDKNKFHRVFTYSVSTVVSLYCIFGCLGYLFYGDETKSVITKNLSTNFLTGSVKVSLCIALLLTYTLQMFPVSSIMDEVVASRLGELPDGVNMDDPHLKLSRRFYTASAVMRIGFVAFTCIVAAIFSNFGLIVSLVGALSNSAISFTLPMLFYLRICLPSDAPLSKRALPYFLIGFGLLASVLGLVFTIKDMVNGTSD